MSVRYLEMFPDAAWTQVGLAGLKLLRRNGARSHMQMLFSSEAKLNPVNLVH